MNLHRVTYITPDGDKKQQFAGSADAASKLSTKLREDGKTLKKPERSTCEVPTSKTELIGWLNENATVLA